MSVSEFGDERSAAAAGRAAGGAGAQAPRLRDSAHYASWRPDMEVWLERHGAKGVHAQVIAPEQWKTIAKKVQG